jgi:hypothetical protein
MLKRIGFDARLDRQNRLLCWRFESVLKLVFRMRIEATLIVTASVNDCVVLRE